MLKESQTDLDHEGSRASPPAADLDPAAGAAARSRKAAGFPSMAWTAQAALLASAAFGCGGSAPGPAPAADGVEVPVLPAEGYVRLAFNESPFGPPPCVVPAMEEMLARPCAMEAPDPDFLPGINRYPDFLNVEATDQAARRHGISSRHVVVCCGISELISMCAKAYLGAGKHLLTPEACYLLPAHCAGRRGCPVRTAPMDGTHGIDLDALLAQTNADTGLIYLANPNNPTGSLLAFEDLEAFVKLAAGKSPEAVVLVDEAYMDYVLEQPLPEAVRLVKNHRVLVGRTFSKAFGLAGLRAGYAVGHEDLVLDLNGFLSGYLGGDPGWRMFEGNLNRLGVAAMVASLSDEGLAFLDSVRTRNAALRGRLAGGLLDLGYDPLPSHASFLLVSVNSDGENLRRHLCANRILVQAGASFHPGYRDRVRISVGSEDEIEALLTALKSYDPSRTYPSCFPVFYHGI